MSRRSIVRSAIGLAAGLLLAVPGRALACATCFGAGDARMAQGLSMGILSLLLVVVFVLGGIGAFFIYLARRAAAITATPDAAKKN